MKKSNVWSLAILLAFFAVLVILPTEGYWFYQTERLKTKEAITAIKTRSVDKEKKSPEAHLAGAGTLVVFERPFISKDHSTLTWGEETYIFVSEETILVETKGKDYSVLIERYDRMDSEAKASVLSYEGTPWAWVLLKKAEKKLGIAMLLLDTDCDGVPDTLGNPKESIKLPDCYVNKTRI